MVDPIADMLNRIRNAQAVHKETVEVPFSQIKHSIAKILANRGFITATELKGKKTKKSIEITLQYSNGTPRIRGMRRVSKPGQRTYAAVNAVRRVKGGQGVAVLSTSKGLMTDTDAKKEGVGGEILCELW